MIKRETLEKSISDLESECERLKIAFAQCEAAIRVYKHLLGEFDKSEDAEETVSEEKVESEVKD